MRLCVDVVLECFSVVTREIVRFHVERERDEDKMWWTRVGTNHVPNGREKALKKRLDTKAPSRII